MQIFILRYKTGYSTSREIHGESIRALIDDVKDDLHIFEFNEIGLVVLPRSHQVFRNHQFDTSTDEFGSSIVYVIDINQESISKLSNRDILKLVST